MKNLEFVELNALELEEVNGGSWISDAIDWIGDAAQSVWKFMKKYGLKDGRTGIAL
jgi:hypothetical protein